MKNGIPDILNINYIKHESEKRVDNTVLLKQTNVQDNKNNNHQNVVVSLSVNNNIEINVLSIIQPKVNNNYITPNGNKNDDDDYSQSKESNNKQTAEVITPNDINESSVMPTMVIPVVMTDIGDKKSNKTIENINLANDVEIIADDAMTEGQ